MPINMKTIRSNLSFVVLIYTFNWILESESKNVIES